MLWLYAFCAIIANYVCAFRKVRPMEDYFYSCVQGLDGVFDIYYLSADPYAYGRLDSFKVNRNVKFDFVSLDETYKTDNLMRVGCVCTVIQFNSYQYIVMPMMIDGLMSDALTLCIYRDSSKSVMDVMNLPTDSLEHYMIAQYVVQMPRSLVDYTLEGKHDCINKNGQPSSIIPGQKMCYYYNYVLYKKTNLYVDTIEKRSDNGPFLGSQLPDFKRLANITLQDPLAFANYQWFAMCAVVKTAERIDSDLWKPDCVYTEYKDNEHPLYTLEIATCCCNAATDPACEQPMKGARDNLTYCSIGNQDRKNGEFGNFCATTIHQVYVIHEGNWELLIANEGKTKEAKYFPAKQYLPSVEIQCAGYYAIVSQASYCSGTSFCNSHLGSNLLIKRCHYSFALDFKTNGCAVVFYNETGKLHVVSPAWFDMEKSEVYHLFTSTHNGFSYDVSAAFLVFHKISESCKSKEPRTDRQYYVLHCKFSNCDENYTESFFNSKEFYDAFQIVDHVKYPRCENGSIKLVTTDGDLHKLNVQPKTTHIIALYCTFLLTFDFRKQKYYIDMSFWPVYPRPPDCNEQLTQLGENTIYYCCYAARADKPYINPECHYSTALQKLVILLKAKSIKGPGNQNRTSIGIYENADDCEQRRIGQFGNYRQCTPGGAGCFHLLQMDLTKKDVVASCIGHAENLIASKGEYYDNFGEAMICRTPESRDSCQYVYEGGKLYLLCCCQSEDVYDHVAQCTEDSKMMFHESDHPLK
uniref:ZP domain-containing protein n=1 Tax=Panagrellus redivivus TaxID=6233 RepID=A0A7E4VVV7_PANRE